MVFVPIENSVALIMLGQTVVCLILWSFVVGAVNCIGYYTIVAPENIRPHSDYRVSVTVHNQTEPVRIKLSVTDDKNYEKSTEVSVSNNQTRLAIIRLDAFAVNSNYEFVAEGVSGLVFKNSTSLNVESKNCSIFIQTDKGIYKPGEAIKFRVLILNFRLQPVELERGQLTVWITDSEKNRIKQWRDVEVRKGVFSDELQLSDLPVLGDWSIRAEVGEESRKKTVKIAEYVLPKFSVEIDSPSHFNVKDGKVRATIRSKYTYGQFVKGKVVVSMTPTSFHAWSSSKNNAILKGSRIDGKTAVEFDIEDDLKLELDNDRTSAVFEMRAVVIEEPSERNQTITKRIHVHLKRYKIKAIDRDSQFQTGSPVRVNVAITYQDGKPVVVNEANRDVVIVKVPNSQSVAETFFKHPLTPNGTVEAIIPTSRLDESGFTLRAKYQDEEAEVGYFYPRPQMDPERLEIKVLTKKPSLNKRVFVEVQSLDVMTHFTYQIVSQGKLIYSDSVIVPERNYHVFDFLATFDLTPLAHVIVYYFNSDDLISTKIDIEIRDELENFVKLKLSDSNVAPGDAVNITVTSNPRSYVGLLGVDQSVLLLKKNADITVASAFDERELYQYQLHEKEKNERGTLSPFYFNNYFGDFRSSRMILFTNAKKDDTPGVYNKAGIGDSVGFAASPLIVGASPHIFGAPAAFNRRPVLPGEASAAPPKVRTEFPETWLWQSIDADSFNGTASLESHVPDTITSWMISAISIDPITGLGLTKVPRVLEVFQPFFVSLSLPYSVKRGETLYVPAIVYNYMANDVDVEVMLHNEDDEFEFIYPMGDGEEMRNRSIHVTANNAAQTRFVIKPKKIGSISLKVTATSPLAGDGVQRDLVVEPEGVAQYLNIALLVDLKDVPSLETTLDAEIPEEAVPDSVRAEVTCVGDLLGGTIQNINRMIRLPTGCGEQNMLNFVPNIVILNYLQATGQSKPDIEAKVKSFTEKGYQRELSYRHADGSFSAFGKTDRSGSTWLTAFVAKSFRQAAAHIDIDENVIGAALKWLNKTQRPDGSFPEIGEVSHKAMQGGATFGIPLTAYVMTAFLENKERFPIYEETIRKAIDNIVRPLERRNDVYGLALAAYALELADHHMKEDLLDRLLEKASKKGDRSWVNRAGRTSKTLDVEMTSYALLTLLHNDQHSRGLPFFKWLLSQRNDKGGFSGTQDTVLGLQALAEYAKRIVSKDNNVQIVVSYNDTNETHISVNDDNALVLQSFKLPPTVHSIDVNATGIGLAFLQLSYQYYLNSSDVQPSFKVKPRITDKTTNAHLNLEVCVSFTPNGKEIDEEQSSMVVMEVSLPSGFAAEPDLVDTLMRTSNVKKVETRNGDSVVVLYFDYLKVNEPMCPLVEAYQAHIVAEQKPAPIVVYDYYDSSKRAREFYTIPTKSVCDICEANTCSKQCK